MYIENRTLRSRRQMGSHQYVYAYAKGLAHLYSEPDNIYIYAHTTKYKLRNAIVYVLIDVLRAKVLEKMLVCPGFESCKNLVGSGRSPDASYDSHIGIRRLPVHRATTCSLRSRFPQSFAGVFHTLRGYARVTDDTTCQIAGAAHRSTRRSRQASTSL